MKNNVNITYRTVGDFRIPNLTLPPEEASVTLGKWGKLHKDYLLKHKKVLFVTLLAEDRLWQYLADIDAQAQQMFDTLIEQMKKAEGATEELKEHDQWEWVQRMSNIEQRAREVVNNEIVYK